MGRTREFSERFGASPERANAASMLCIEDASYVAARSVGHAISEQHPREHARHSQRAMRITLQRIHPSRMNPRAANEPGEQSSG